MEDLVVGDGDGAGRQFDQVVLNRYAVALHPTELRDRLSEPPVAVGEIFRHRPIANDGDLRPAWGRPAVESHVLRAGHHACRPHVVGKEQQRDGEEGSALGPGAQQLRRNCKVKSQ